MDKSTKIAASSHRSNVHTVYLYHWRNWQLRAASYCVVFAKALSESESFSGASSAFSSSVRYL
nr:unnamed protein product [Callosobruchus chinensis]